MNQTMDNEYINDLLVNQMLEDHRWVENWFGRQWSFNPSFPSILAVLFLERDSDKKEQKEQILWKQMKMDASLDEPELKSRRLIYQAAE